MRAYSLRFNGFGRPPSKSRKVRHQCRWLFQKDCGFDLGAESSHLPAIPDTVLDEWIESSGIHPDIARINLRYFSGQTAIDEVLYSKEVRAQDGTVQEYWQNRYQHLSQGGWGCGSTPQSQWLCIKPNSPRFDKDRNRPIKYEHPPKEPTELFRLGVSRQIWQKVCDRYGLDLPEVLHESKNGELTLFWNWVRDTPEIAIVLTEGCKKAASLLSQGIVAIAAPGCWGLVRTPKDEKGKKCGVTGLHRQLSPFIREGRSFLIAFDQDLKQKTIRDVNIAIEATAKVLAKELKRSGNFKSEQIKVLQWNADYKGIDDLKVDAGEDAVEDAVNLALPFFEWEVKQLYRLTYPINYSFESEKFHNLEIPTTPIIGIKGAKSLGKTWLLEQWCKRWLAEGKKVLIPSHRRNLAKHLAKRLSQDNPKKIFYVEEVENETGDVVGLALCMDSLHKYSKAKFNPSDWSGCIVIIDEAEQVIWHTLDADTEVKKRRVLVLENLRAVCQISVANGGQIILSDADLCDLSIDFVKGLLGFDAEIYLLENTQKPPAWDIFNYPGSDPRYLMAELEQQIAEDNRVLIHTSAQKIQSKWGTQELEIRLKSKFPDKRILRIDGESIGDTSHAAFGAIDKLNALISLYDIVITSPVIETGVSIEEGDFDSVFQISNGVQTCDSSRQTIARYRKPVPRYTWFAKAGLGWIGNRSTNWRELKRGLNKGTKENIQYLQKADNDALTDEVDIDFLPCCLDTWAKKAALNNAGMWAYRETILNGLVEEGHNIINVEIGSELQAEGDTLKGELKTQTDAEYKAYCEKVSAAIDIDETEYQRIKDASSKIEDERLAAQKYYLNKQYKIDVTPDLVEKDDDGWYGKLLLHYFLSVGNAHLYERDKAIADAQITSGEGAIYQRDFNKRLINRKVRLYEKLGIPKLLDEEEISVANPVVQEIAANCAAAVYDVKSILNKTLKDLDKPTSVAAQMLSLIGYELPFLYKKGSRGNQTRIYGKPSPGFLKDPISGKIIKDKNGKAIPISDNRELVFERWLELDKERRTKKELQKLIQDLETCEHIDQYRILESHQLLNEAWQQISADSQKRIRDFCANPNQEKPQIPEHLILDPSDQIEYKGWLEYIRLASELSLDIETFGEGKYGALHPWNGQIRLIQISDGNLTFIADLGGRFDNRDERYELLKPFLQVLEAKLQDPETRIIGHNIHFDLRKLATQYGLRYASNVWDTLLGFRVFFGDYGSQGTLESFGLGYLVNKFLKLDIDKSAQTSDWGGLLTQEQIQYAANDSGATFLLFRKLLNIYQNPADFGYAQLAQDGLLDAWKDENNAISPAVEIELAGLPIDREMAQRNLENIEAIKAKLLEQWRQLSPSITHNQVAKLKEHFKQVYGIRLKQLTKSELNLHKDNPLVMLRLRIDALDKQAQQIQSFIRSSKRDGRIHTVYKTLTGFGRFSSGDSKKFKDLPNLQSISAKSNPILNEFKLPKVREAIRPKSGRVMAVIDLAGAHGRIAADQAQDPVAIAGNNDETIDNHSKVAEYVARAQGLDWSWDHIAKAKSDKNHPDHVQAKLFRDTAKNTYYGWLNGAGARRIQEQITANTGKQPSLDACKAAIEGCEKLYPKVVEFRNNLMKKLKQEKIKLGSDYFCINRMNTIGARILHKMEISRLSGELEPPYTNSLAAIWSRIEATAVKRALPKIIDLQRQNPEWGLQLINYVHDECDIEINEDYAEPATVAVNNIIGDEFQKVLASVSDGRENNWRKLVVESWADK